jgi:hypothetical protein
MVVVPSPPDTSAFRRSLLRKYKRRSQIFSGIYAVLLVAAFIPSMRTAHVQRQIYSRQKQLWPQEARVGSSIQALLKMPNRSPAEYQQLADLMKQQSSLSAQSLNYSSQLLVIGRVNLRYGVIQLVISLGAVAGFTILAVKYRRALHRFHNGLCLHCGYDLRGGGARCPECGTVCHTPDGDDEARSYQK